MKIKKNDIVKILYGKDAGKEGKVLKVIPSSGKLVIEGINMYKKHFKGDGKKRESEIVDIVKPVDIAKVMLVCPACQKTTRVTVERNDKKVKNRVCRKCSKSIDTLEKKTEKKTEEKKVEKKAEKKKVVKKTKAKTKK